MESIRFIGKSDAINIHKDNETDEEVEFIVFRFVPDGVDKREIIKNDKAVVNR